MKKVIRLTESDLVNLVKKVISEQNKKGFDQYAKGIFKEWGFTKVSETEYKNELIKAKVKFNQSCESDGFKYGGLIYFKNDKEVYKGCADACWVWWKKNVQKPQN